MQHNQEDGSEAVQLAWALPLLVVMVFSIIQLGINLYSSVALGSEIEKASWEVDAAQLIIAADKDAVMRETILRGAPGLDAERLMVSGTAVGEFEYGTDKALQQRGLDIELGLTHMQTDRKTAVVSSTISYEMPSIITMPGLSEQVLERTIRHTQMLSAKVEVG